MERISIFQRLAPILFFQCYLTASVLLFAFGPWYWPLESGRALYVFVALAQLALLLGYLSGAFAQPRGYSGSIPAVKWLGISVVLTLILYIPSLLWVTGGIFDPIGALREPSVAYYRFQEMQQQDLATTPISYVRTLTAPLLALVLPLLASMWTLVPMRMRVLGVLAAVSHVSLFVFTGRNKGIIDVILLLPWLLALVMTRQRARAIGRSVIVLGAVTVLVLVVFVNLFSRNVAGRTGTEDATAWVRLLGGMQPDLNHPLLRAAPPALVPAVLGLSINQTHGYFALALALDKPFTSSWGLGHSYVLRTLEQRITGENKLADRSYPARLEREDDWSMTEYWHTLYPWIASDVTFAGTLLVMFLIGRLFALTWLDSLRGQNPFAMGLLFLIVTLLYYVPASNIVLGQPEGFAGFWGLLVLWLLSRTRLQQPVSVRATGAEFAHA